MMGLNIYQMVRMRISPSLPNVLGQHAAQSAERFIAHDKRERVRWLSSSSVALEMVFKLCQGDHFDVFV